jgi:hypothetical protein
MARLNNGAPQLTSSALAGEGHVVVELLETYQLQFFENSDIFHRTEHNRLWESLTSSRRSKYAF